MPVQIIDNDNQPITAAWMQQIAAQRQAIHDAQQNELNRQQQMAQARQQVLMQQAGFGHENEIARFNAQKQLELAKATHQMQLQREQMRDTRMQNIQQMRNKSVLDALSAKSQYSAVAAAAGRVADLGGDVSWVNPNDPKVMDRLQAAYNTTREHVKMQTAQAIASRSLQNEQLQSKWSDPATAAVDARAEQEIKQTAGGMAVQAFMKSGSPLSQKVQDLAQTQGLSIQQAIQQVPNAAQEFSGYFNQYQGQAEMMWKAKNPQDAQLIAGRRSAEKQIDANNQAIKQLGFMPGVNGRTVPNPVFAEAQNMASDVLNGNAKDDKGGLVADSWFPGYSNYRKQQQQQQAGGGNAVNPQQPPAVAPNTSKLGGGAGGSWGPVAAPTAAGAPVGAANPVVPPAAANASPAISGPVTMDNSGVLGVAGNALSNGWNNFKNSQFLAPNTDQGIPWGQSISNVMNSPIAYQGPLNVSPNQVGQALSGWAMGTPNAPLPVPQRQNVVVAPGQVAQVAAPVAPQGAIAPQFSPQIYNGPSGASLFDPSSIMSQAPNAGVIQAQVDQQNQADTANNNMLWMYGR